MATRELDDLVRRATALTADDQLRLAATLIEQARQQKQDTPPAYWRDLRGRVPEPALGDDAQAWVTRTREQGNLRER